ncbi:MAG: RNA polymerase sigma-70 factor (ECF subfamily) [Candidatus Paceibacteria bacterium]|jgi:RNA polymerase sigma-70 factor (ECF subfamily)
MTDPITDGEEEAQRIILAQAGDQDAFDALVRSHFARVYALLFRMHSNHEDAEDLAQECFIKAQRSIQFFRAESSFSTWLYRIALHQSRDHFRSRSRRPRLAPLPEEGMPASSTSGPLTESLTREMGTALRDAIDQLPHKLRAALLLRTQEGMEYEQMASVLECNPQTARVHVMKARRRLTAWLEDWKQGEGTR